MHAAAGEEASPPVAAMTDPSPGAALMPEPTIQGVASGPRPRWVRRGSSSNPDPARAIAEALSALFPDGFAAVEAPALVLAFLSTAYPMDSMAEVLQAALGSAPLIGCSTSGELTDGRSLRHSLVLWALGGALRWAGRRCADRACSSSTVWRAAQCWRAPQPTGSSSVCRSCWAPCP